VELNSGNLVSRCEAVIVMLQGLMISKVELVQGCDKGCDRFGTSQDFQQSHVSVTGCNNCRYWRSYSLFTNEFILDFPP